ncbi:RIP metalloprotease RseP [Kroppenstedtia pulmonis]|uniref:Zinc metalloprotease n=1 Tax=Kroppenstedtia pulmonis TaxID=1380685 RepID=A0A7D3XRW1_9BACL|nr:RIP metalloprotease RseP [Kroppenstedtia pulmonis]QKG84568.1 RIP metalloprotease RseP [Kroppenstedtia pulmonis]
MQTIVSFVLLISVLVFIHELGHFIFAKRAGILVREFAIGFGPKLVSWFKGETLYSIRLLPLGGYVRMAGEDPEIIELKTGTQVTVELDGQGKVLRIRSRGKPEQDGSGYEEWMETAGSDLPGHLPKVQSVEGGKLLEADLEDRLFIRLELEDEREVEYPLHPKALIQYDGQQMVQIAPLDRQMGSKSILQRTLTILAGPVFNLLLAVILMATLTFFVGVGNKVSVQGVLPDSPAMKAGLQQGDVIEKVAGKPVKEAKDISMPLQQAGDKPITLKVKRGEDTFETTVRPEIKGDQRMIGIEMKPEMRKASVSEAIVEGFKKTYDFTLLMVHFLGQLITGQAGVDSLAGPVGIADMAGQAAEAGWLPLLSLAGLLSLNLGILNLLPFPMLDGGRLVFLLLEAIRGKPVDPNKEGMVHFVGFAMLMMLMVLVTYNDIVRVFFDG